LLNTDGGPTKMKTSNRHRVFQQSLLFLGRQPNDFACFKIEDLARPYWRGNWASQQPGVNVPYLVPQFLFGSCWKSCQRADKRKRAGKDRIRYEALLRRWQSSSMAD